MPFDRPLLRIANALNLSMTKESAKSNSIRKGNHLTSIGRLYHEVSRWKLIDVLLDANSIDTYLVNIRFFFAQRCSCRNSKQWGSVVWCRYFFLSFIVLLPNIFSWKSWCFVQFLEVMSLWFRVLMNTIIIFKMVLMIRYVSFQVYSQCTCQRKKVYSQCTCQRKKVYSQCFIKLKAVLRCSFFPSQLRCKPAGGMSISLYLNK